MPGKRRHHAACLLAALVIVASCGDDDGGPSAATDVPVTRADGTVDACGLVDLSELEDLFGLEMVPDLREDAPFTSRMAEHDECNVRPVGETDARALGIRYTRFNTPEDAVTFFEGDVEAFNGVPTEGPGERATLIEGIELEVLDGDVIVSMRFNPQELPTGDVESLLDELLAEALSRLPT
jgi:hypothetical protein